MRSSLPCFLTFCRSGIPTSCYIFKCFLLLVIIWVHEIVTWVLVLSEKDTFRLVVVLSGGVVNSCYSEVNTVLETVEHLEQGHE